MIDWVELGTDLMHSSRKALGYSYEAMGRLLNVSSKTWERWEKRGAVPRPMLERVADVLRLEIERPAPQKVSVEPQPDGRLERMESDIREIRRLLESKPG